MCFLEHLKIILDPLDQQSQLLIWKISGSLINHKSV